MLIALICVQQCIVRHSAQHTAQLLLLLLVACDRLIVVLGLGVIDLSCGRLIHQVSSSVGRTSSSHGRCSTTTSSGNAAAREYIDVGAAGPADGAAPDARRIRFQDPLPQATKHSTAPSLSSTFTFPLLYLPPPPPLCPPAAMKLMCPPPPLLSATPFRLLPSPPPPLCPPAAMKLMCPPPFLSATPFRLLPSPPHPLCPPAAMKLMCPPPPPLPLCHPFPSLTFPSSSPLPSRQ